MHNTASQSTSINEVRQVATRIPDEIDLADIVRAVQADIAHIKEQLDELAPFPKGKSNSVTDDYNCNYRPVPSC
jgi:anti-sigma-K factor RskA